jgi:hypothetical protein
MEGLPNEMFGAIASCADVVTRFNLKFVSKVWYDIIDQRIDAREAYKYWLVNQTRLGLDCYWLKHLALFEMKYRNIYYNRDLEYYSDVNILMPFRSMKIVKDYPNLSFSNFPKINKSTINVDYDDELTSLDLIDLDVDGRSAGYRGRYDENIIKAMFDGNGFEFYDIDLTYYGHRTWGTYCLNFNVKPRKENIRSLDALIIYSCKLPIKKHYIF